MPLKNLTTKSDLLQSILQGEMIHRGSVREPNNGTQLDKWEDESGTQYLTEKKYSTPNNGYRPSSGVLITKLFMLVPITE